MIVKGAGQPYRPGRRDWYKYKRRDTTEAIVGGVTGTLARPDQLVLGRYDSRTGRLRMVGRSTPLPPRTRETVGAELTPARADHPWPAELPPGWHGRDPTPYTRVHPELVVEVSADVATDAGGWRHPVRYQRLRPDIVVEDVPHDLNIDALSTGSLDGRLPRRLGAHLRRRDGRYAGIGGLVQRWPRTVVYG